MDKKSIECRLSRQKLNNQIQNLELALLSADKIISNDSLIIKEKSKEIKSLKGSLTQSNKSLKKQKALKWVFGGVGLFGTFFFAVKN